MSERVSFGFYLAALTLSAARCLDFPRPPTSPKQSCGFLTGKPSVTRRTLCRQDDTDDPTMQSFLGMVVDCGAQVL